MTSFRQKPSRSTRSGTKPLARFTLMGHAIVVVAAAVLTIAVVRSGGGARLYRVDLALWGIIFLCASGLAIAAQVSGRSLHSVGYGLLALGALAAASGSMLSGPALVAVAVLAALAFIGSLATLRVSRRRTLEG